MKAEFEGPLVSLFFKGLAGLVTMAGLLSMFTPEGIGSIPFGLSLILGVAPTMWWMGVVVDLLAKVVHNTHQGSKSERFFPTMEPVASAKTTRSSKPRDYDNDESSPPSYSL